MNHRAQSFFKQEKLLCLVLILIGIVFTSLYFFAYDVSPQYTYFFFTLTGFGLIFIMNYAYRYLFLKRQEKRLISENPCQNMIDEELSWLNLRISETEKYRVILQVALVIGLFMVLVGFAGFMKQLLGSAGLGILFGCAIWFSAELMSELQLKEYKTYLEK